jgi:hypothetical protein
MDLVDSLDRDPGQLLAALEGLPRTLLHGDLKLANVALLRDGRTAFIDWQMTALAPVAVELGWLLVTNSALLPVSPEATLEQYERAVGRVSGTNVGVVRPFEPTARFAPGVREAALGSASGMASPRFRSVETVLGDWDRQRDLAWIVGLLLRGWRKGLDAEAGATLASGVPAAADLAWWCDRAGAAAARWLAAATD